MATESLIRNVNRQTAGFFCLVLVVCAGCVSTTYVSKEAAEWASQPLPTAREIHRVYLLGDAGDINAGEEEPPVFASVVRSTSSSPVSHSLVFLGDNVYCCGLPDSAAATRPNAQRILDKEFQFAREVGGRTFFIPGNHDWNDSGESGAEQVRRMARYVNAALGEGTFVPAGALPGPAIVELEDDIVLIAIDTEWWLTRGDRPYGDAGEYEIDEDLDFVVALNDALSRHAGDRVLMVGHHPMHSQGKHNGRFPARIHLFPLTLVKRNAWIPLPVVGSLFVLGTRMFGGRQDLPNPRYRSLRAVVRDASAANESFIYASGHEHNLQYFSTGPDHQQKHFIVSGAASAPTYVAGGGGATFTERTLGYSTVSYYDDGSAWASFWAVETDGSDRLAFRTRLQEGRQREVIEIDETAIPDYRDSTITVAISQRYAAGPFRSALLGGHNRDLWTTAVTVPVLDLGREAGGLHPVKRGGGMQTVSLRLESEDGQGYVLRSLDKDPSVSVPANLRGTLATAVVQDQISSIDPYGAFAIPPLAEAVGVYHTLPKLVYVPDDPRLGEYRETFANQVMMLEHRPDDDVSEYDNYGNSTKVVGESKLYEELREDNDNRVDAQAFLRARLFDMLLSDWDRHRGQWRWSRFDDPDGKGDIYRPIPRDRDWAFNRMNGFISVVAPAFDPKFQAFNPKFHSIKGLTLNGLEQDRRFLAGISRDDWVRQAVSVRDAVTPAVVEDAVSRLPEAIRALDGERIRSNLLSRAEDLTRAANNYYELLAHVVDVVGSDKHELFEVERHENGDVTVRMFKSSKDGERRQLLLERRFLESETKQIRLFGLDGSDTFELHGSASRSIEVIIVAGPGKDRINDDSAVAGSGRKTIYIDTDRGTDLQTGSETKLRITDDPVLNTYDPNDFKHDVSLPQLYFRVNKDDGFYLGGGALFIRHGFRRIPFASQQRVRANFAARTTSFNVRYEGTWTSLSRLWDFGLGVNVRSPNSTRNFYGLGNETDNTSEDNSFYQARLSSFDVTPVFHRSVTDALTFGIGPYLRYTRVREESERFLAQQPGITDDTFEDQWYTGLVGTASVDAVDDGANPRQGVRWSNSVEIRYGLGRESATFAKYATDLAFYVSPSLSPQLTLALRAGGTHNQGRFPFFEASTLGGSSNVRGYRGNRYAGRSAAYGNSEVRLKLFDLSTYVAQGPVGTLGFFDAGRVWTDGESSSIIHTGYGGGIWANLFDSITLTTTVGFSEDERTYTLDFGFQY